MMASTTLRKNASLVVLPAGLTASLCCAACRTDREESARVMAPTTELQDLPDPLFDQIAQGVDTKQRCAPRSSVMRFYIMW